MLSQTRHAASRLLTSIRPSTSTSTHLRLPSSSPSSSSSFLLSRRSLHSSPHPAAGSSHSSHSSPTSHVNPRVAKYLSEDVNGWFLGEVPGYHGELLPGGASRFYCATFAWLMGACYVGMAIAVTYKPESDPNVWAKEYVLNVEKYKVPDCPDPFPAAEQE